MNRVSLNCGLLLISGVIAWPNLLLAANAEIIPKDVGLLYESDDNDWLQSVELGGRFNYQVARVDGTDVNGSDFKDDYDEYRRLRLGVGIEFLRYFEAEIEANFVSDDRFRNDINNDLDWGYDRFQDVTLEFDFGEAFDPWVFDDIKMTYGRMKLRMGAELHQSSRVIYTVERSALSSQLGSAISRPTGFTMELDKGDWELVIGAFSAEDDSDFLADWGEGAFYYASLGWEPTEQLTLLLDYSQNDYNEMDDALGYSWASVFSVIYEQDNWGVMASAAYKDNGGGVSEPNPRRQGNVYSYIVMPWYWLLEDRLQAVAQFQYAHSENEQGLQIASRYIRAAHDNPAIDVDNGRGDEHHSVYAGLNYHFQRDKLKLMLGASYDDLSTRNDSTVRAVTWQAAFRVAF
ncbi:MAG: porin [Opitutaceae bacterium]